jgi:hypothetical protein
VAKFEKGRLCAHGRSLVPLVKTLDFGMTPEGAKLKILQSEPLARSAGVILGRPKGNRSSATPNHAQYGRVKIAQDASGI